jgi:hypothetical protein
MRLDQRVYRKAPQRESAKVAKKDFSTFALRSLRSLLFAECLVVGEFESFAGIVIPKRGGIARGICCLAQQQIPHR